MSSYETVTARSPEAALATNKLIRNTYTLLSMTLLFSALTATASVFMEMGPMTYLVSIGVAMLLAFFVLPKTANSASGLGVVFAITGLFGFALGPLLNMYLSLSNGPQIIGMAMGGTGVIFLSLSGYALTTRKNFSFMGGFLITGMIVALIAALANIFLAIPALSLAISAVVIMLMSGFILYDTSRMIHEPHGNYLMMTVSLYLSIFNLFVHLLHLLGALSNND
ncbi:MAG: Bax inhibitor-1/YccA family protein [Gammaproteobacteria bacterium]|nr:Bax inhibitor-1/YccA family protein [Gammaproteobacteria bacterium]MCW8841649.1 Bax inhibitor-1/YccA family protein [Gammaproteobacteria bacterium]MCW8928159.1 Bax inhibitor-1/YccA family protein [Gammaproteobacteria bacterium]MCW8957854.1 Bax inhibitor-1/YccA family protein [Gammaproteobacteria bacterium]MCW8973376.1 Bax inhibitor-1/YccA family protein [Gammaproteobacteria bacterium]